MMTIDEFRAALKRHDWTWYHADDARVYRAGQAREKELREIAMKQGGEYWAAFEAALRGER